MIYRLIFLTIITTYCPHMAAAILSDKSEPDISEYWQVDDRQAARCNIVNAITTDKAVMICDNSTIFLAETSTEILHRSAGMKWIKDNRGTITSITPIAQSNLFAYTIWSGVTDEGSENNGLITIRERDSGNIIRSFSAHISNPCCSASSDDGKYIATGSWDESAKIWEASSGKNLAVLTGHSQSVFAVQFTHDSERLITASGDGTVRVWNINSKKEESRFDMNRQPGIPKTRKAYRIDISPSENTVAIAGSDSVIYLWNYASQKISNRIKTPSRGVSSVVYNFDGTMIGSASYGDKNVYIWDCSTGNLVHRFSVEAPSDILDEVSLAFHPTKNLLYAVCSTGELYIFDVVKVRRIKIPIVRRG